MEKKCVLLTLFVFVFLLTNIFDGVGFCLRVIPNAPWQHGFGIDTPAGSGRHLGTPSTNVIKVTNLNDSGPGSLRDALVNQPSPKTIVFEVSGNIELQSKIEIGAGGTGETTGSYITIAGQTAPSPGITIKNKTVYINRNAHDILIQHIRFRHGDEDLNPAESESWDSLILDNHYSVERGWTPPYNIVIDHCSISWAVDENMQTGAERVTFSNNIFSEGLNCNKHPKGCHSKGPLVTGGIDGPAGDNTAFVNNLFSHNSDRNPAVSAGSVVVSNNVLNNCRWCGIHTWDAAHLTYNISIVGNYIINYSEWGYRMYIKGGQHSNTKIYLGNDNYFSVRGDENYSDGQIQTDPWSVVENRRSAGEPLTDVPQANRAPTATDAIWPTDYTAVSAAEARAYVLKNAGARPADRDAVDVRIINEVINGTGNEIDCIECTNADCVAEGDPYKCCTGPGTGNCNAALGGWPNLAKNTRTLTVPSNPNEVQANGYTKLEEWLNEFSRTVEGKPGRPETFTY